MLIVYYFFHIKFQEYMFVPTTHANACVFEGILYLSSAVLTAVATSCTGMHTWYLVLPRCLAWTNERLRAVRVLFLKTVTWSRIEVGTRREPNQQSEQFACSP